MATTAALTVTEFLAQVGEDQRCELVRGEIVPMANAHFQHERVKINGNKVFVLYLAENPIGEVAVETMYQLTESDALQPDLSILLNEQIPAVAPRGLLSVAPVLVFGVVSSESAARLEWRIELFLEKGTRAVVVAFTDTRSIRIFEPSGRLVRGEQKVEVDFLPGFSVPASRFFEGL